MNWRNRDLGPWCLGTAQLGSDYGIANVHGHPQFEQALEIVSTAWNAGIVLFDTAASYGNGQQVLGKRFESLGIQDLANARNARAEVEIFFRLPRGREACARTDCREVVPTPIGSRDRALTR